MRLFDKITSTLSTAHALVLSAIELPDALHYVVEFARENGTGDELAKASKLVKSLAVALAEDMSLKEERDELAKRCSDHDDIVQSLHEIIDRATDKCDQLRVEVTTLQLRLNETSDARQHAESERFRISMERIELVKDRDALRAKLEYLTRWRSQSDEPCPFPNETWVFEKSSSNEGRETDGCYARALRPGSLWRPANLDHYEEQ